MRNPSRAAAPRRLPRPSGPPTLRFLTQNHEAEARDRLPTRNSIQLGFQTLARILDSHPGSKPRGGLQPRLRSPPRNHDREARGGRQTRVRPRAPHQQPWGGGDPDSCRQARAADRRIPDSTLRRIPDTKSDPELGTPTPKLSRRPTQKHDSEARGGFPTWNSDPTRIPDPDSDPRLGTTT